MEITEKFKSAVRLFQQGESEASLAICREIIESQPDDTDALMLLGLIHHQLRENETAVHYLEMAVKSAPDNSYPLFYLGNIYHEEGDLEKASACFQKAVEINPSFGDAYYNLAIVLEKQEEHENALIAYKKALDLNPDHADVYNNIGNLLLKMKRFDEAVPYLKNAIQMNPSYVLALNNLAMALKGQGCLDEAVGYMQKAIETDPSSADLYFNLAIILKEKGDGEEAVRCLHKAIDLDPSLAAAHYNLALVLKEGGRSDEAVSHFQKAIEIKPSFADAYCGLADIYEESGMADEALSLYQKALEINPDDAEAHWNMSLALLATGAFRQGWREYEWRFMVKDFRQSSYPSYPVPRWDGSSPEDKMLFVFAEQGVGEEIMFASCLPELISESGQCVVKCDERLVPLFARSFPKARVISHAPVPETFSDDASTTPLKIAMGSLPFFFRQDLAGFPQYESYLVPDTSGVSLWRSRFDALGRGLKIGISWRGGGKVSEKRLRSTALDQWTALFSIPGIHFINLQYGDCSEELGEAKETLGVTIHHWEDADPLKDLDGFAAQVAALDLVISVDNATVHTAGAVGTPVWTLLPFASDWRWMRKFDDSPWYKTMRLFRQNAPGEWSTAFEEIAANLREFISTGVLPEIAPAHSYRATLSGKPASSLHPSPFIKVPKSRTYTCAVVTPVGPGHKELYRECLESVRKSFSDGKGLFSDVIPIEIDDSGGMLGRSKARNRGIAKAAEQDADWIFFLDADDIMAPSAFAYAAPYLGQYDAVWGSIWTIERGETKASERPGQLPFLYSIEDLLSYDPFVTLQMGHFVKTSAALSVLFDESLHVGEDFDYYFRVWEKYRCIKIPLPFFYNRRGFHSQGPRSASGSEWNRQVEKIISERRAHWRRLDTTREY